MPADEQSLLRADVFLADVAIFDSVDADTSMACLTANERGRFERMQSAKRRREFVVGRMLAQLALTHWRGTASAQWTISTDDRGRPYVEPAASGVAAPSISLSHSGDHVACALCEQGMVGVDVETWRARDFMALAGVICAEREHAELARLPEAERMHWFYRRWTLKEACSKALGTGIAAPVRQLIFEWAGSPAQIRFESNKWRESTQFLSFTPGPRASAALALLAPGTGRRWQTRFFAMTAVDRIEPTTPEILAQSA